MADLAHASENDNDLVGDADAQHWAERFASMFRVTRRTDGQDMDTDGLMLTWFAGAIESGKMYEQELH
jgi:hypothetical protein